MIVQHFVNACHSYAQNVEFISIWLVTREVVITTDKLTLSAL